MKKIIIVLIVIILLSVFAFSNTGFTHNWKESLNLAKQQGRRVFIDFYTDWCPPCKKLTRTTFKDKDMVDYFKKENYILLKVNPEKDNEAENFFKVFSYPTLVVFDVKGNEIDRLLGYRDAKTLINELENIKKGIGILSDLLKKYQKDKGNYELMFKIINKYIARADYPRALVLLDKIVSMDKLNKEGKASLAVYRKGYIYYKWKKNDKSVETMLKVHKVYPNSKEAIEGFYAAYYYADKAGMKKKALDILKNFTKKYPNNKYYKEYNNKLK